MARQEINLGVLPNGVGGDTPRVANTKINDMTEELYAAAAGVENKVDKVAGKGLSSNDYTASEKTKLANLIDARDYGIGAAAPETKNIYQIKKGGVTFWNQETAGRPPAAGAGQLLSMTGGANGEFSSFIATSFAEDKVWLSRISGIDRSAWKRFLLAGDFGIGATGGATVAVWPNTSLNNVSSVGSGTYVTIGSTQGMPTSFGGPWTIEYRVRTSTATTIECTQVITNLQGVIMSRGGNGEPSSVPFTGWVQILRAGDYGLGSKGEAITYLSDANVPPASGKARVHPETANGPGVYGTLEQSYLDTGSWTQTVTSIIDGTVFARSKASWLPNPTEWTRQTPETITNANGTATKFPDGTMICRYRGARVTANNANGQLFVSGSNIVTFAATFIDVPVVTVICSDPQVGHCWGIVTTPVNGSNCGIGLMSGLNGSSCAISYMAIGRWR